MATALLVSLTVLVAGWCALIWLDPRLPINPFPPPPVQEGAAGTPSPPRAGRAYAATPPFPPTWTPTATHTALPTRLPTSTPGPTHTPTVTATPYPLRAYTILGMRGRDYPGSQIVLGGTYDRSDTFASHSVFYRSSTLPGEGEPNAVGPRISGMMNVPPGEGPFPVVILCHGQMEPEQYATGQGTARQADTLVQHGYMTLAPDYRGYAASDAARSYVHMGYAEDVLNLIASLPNLEQADPRRVGLWGQGMGGAIALKVAVVNEDVDALVLRNSISADERVNVESGVGNGPGVYGIELLGSLRSNPLIYSRLSPIHYLRYSPPLSIHHGQAGNAVPYQWSEALLAAALEQGTPAELHLYPEGGQILEDEEWELAMERTLAFYDQHLK